MKELELEAYLRAIHLEIYQNEVDYWHFIEVSLSAEEMEAERERKRSL